MNANEPAKPFSARRALGTFVTVFVFGLTIVGTYLGAVAIKKTWAFWVIVPAAAVVTAARYTGPKLLELLTRVRNYPRLLATAAQQSQEIADLKGQLSTLAGSAERRHAEGIMEGRQEVSGALLAIQSRAQLVMEGLSMVGGDLRLFARLVDGQIPQAGARFAWVVAVSGEEKGVVRVLDTDPATGRVVLICVKRTSEQLWAHLEREAEVTPAAPPGMELRPADLDDAVYRTLDGTQADAD